MKIAIVGNSPCILNHEWGEEIDSHDIVVRFNRFETKGYEKYCGTKIDLWIMSWYWEPRSNFYLNMNTKNIVICPRNANLDETKKHFLEKFKNTIQFDNITLIDYNSCTANLMKKMGVDRNPTTGFIGIEYLLQTYPNAEFNIYGFDFCKDLSNQHYFEHFENKNIWHDVKSEESYFWAVFSKKINYKL